MADIMEQTEQAYDNFCQAMGFENGSWNSIFEFSVLCGCPSLYLKPSDLAKHSRIRTKVEMFTGPNANTLLKAYKIQRYTTMGALHTTFLKLRNVILFLGHSIIQIVIGLRHGKTNSA
jgi:hypothetical protein